MLGIQRHNKKLIGSDSWPGQVRAGFIDNCSVLPLRLAKGAVPATGLLADGSIQLLHNAEQPDGIAQLIGELDVLLRHLRDAFDKNILGLNPTLLG